MKGAFSDRDVEYLQCPTWKHIATDQAGVIVELGVRTERLYMKPDVWHFHYW